VPAVLFWGRLARVLYKFMEAKYAAKLVEAGVVRIGTLYNFRKEETHGQHIGDRGEGELKYRMGFGDETYSEENMPDFLKGQFQGRPGKIRFVGGSFVRRESVSDLYVFCVTERREPLPDYGDTRIYIPNPEPFFEEIGSVLQARFLGFHRCLYEERTRPHTAWRTAGQYHALVKPVRYAEEKEVRALWEPVSLPIAPFIATASALPRYCSIDTQD
jgi:hypothetical protein